ncbi:transcriptional regulator, XRE family [Desulforamulus reducens MI-1]|uniref:Transcriptional regulator, XRE family n=1 Tax=Desulforamulus reducens (strain ATCC BAA-1160 / DSM 100696 / MI-1) TaxID=349161 RepID=A4J2W9_DESRM|nr:helix-turn-helix transcriptional regulator [Desulforamulus reducens]ABO49422.1 transcriptional regulator, XRE family [Desulforamulus reducens MI-1]
MDIGSRIKKLRTYQGLSMNELSRRSGVAQSHLSYVESGQRQPTFDVIERICSGLGLSVAEFFNEGFMPSPYSSDINSLVNEVQNLKPSQVSLIKNIATEFSLTNEELELAAKKSLSTIANRESASGVLHIDLLDVFGRKDTVLSAAGVPLSLEDRIEILELIKEKLPADEDLDYENNEVIAASYQGNRFAHIPTQEEVEDIELAFKLAEQQKNRKHKK